MHDSSTMFFDLSLLSDFILEFSLDEYSMG